MRRRSLSPRPWVSVASRVMTTSLVAFVLAGCQANPGSAPTVEEETQTTAQSTQPTAPPTEEMLQLTVGVDSFTGNLNPHLTGNVNPVNTAIADLTLPSAFVQQGDKWVPNSTLLTEVVPDEEDAPRTVTYKINSAAQWSDGTPVSISDFQYLKDTIVSEKGINEFASYQQIESIEPVSGNGVKVTFAQPFAGWKELFRHLLPSHIYKAEDRPFASMMDGSLVASGGAFSVAVVDADRGRVELRRNDRFWGERPAGVDKLILDVVPNRTTGAQMLRTGQMDISMTSPDAVSELAFEEVPRVSSRMVERQVDLSVMLNTRSEKMSNPRLRSSIMGALDTDIIAKVVSGRPSATSPEEPPLAAMVSAEKSVMGADNDNKITIAAPTEDADAVSASRIVVDQLTAVGLPVQGVTRPGADLFANDIPAGEVDVLISRHKTPRTIGDYLNQFHCEFDPSSLRQEREGEPAGVAEQEGDKKTDGNLTGLCNAAMAENLSAMASGKESFAEARRAIEGTVAEADVMLPILRDQQIVAVGPNIEGPEPDIRQWATDPLSGIMVTAPTWKKKESSNPVEPMEEEQ